MMEPLRPLVDLWVVENHEDLIGELAKQQKNELAALVNSIVVRAAKDDDIIMRIRDDCIPFDPVSRHKLDTNADKTSSIGLRIVFGIPQHLQYQNTLGMNVITTRI